MTSKFTQVNTLYKLLVVFSFVLVLLSVLPLVVRAEQASFYLSPPQGDYKVGETFSVKVMMAVEGIAINAAQAKISFPPEKLKVIEVSKSGSIFTLWPTEPNFSNSKGEISFIGGLPSPGFMGSEGRVITILFQGKSEGEARVSFSGEKILANDPWGTDVFSFSQGGSYLIYLSEKAPPVIDREPPYPFEIKIDNEGDPTNPQPLLYFKTRDEISGLSHYEIKIGQGDIFSLLQGQTYPFRMSNQAPGEYFIVVKAVDRAGNSTPATAELIVESIPIPQITICPSVFISGEEVMYIEGTALSNSQVLAFFKKDGKLIKQWEVMVNKDGEWFVAEDGLFKSGIYQIAARAKNGQGAVSHESRPCSVKVILSAIALGPWIISYKLLSLILLIIFLLVLILISYLLWKDRQTGEKIERETKDLKKKFYKEYKELEADIKKELEMLKRIRGTREITEAEKRREEQLLKNLTDVKNVLEKELKDIEK